MKVSTAMPGGYAYRARDGQGGDAMRRITAALATLGLTGVVAAPAAADHGLASADLPGIAWEQMGRAPAPALPSQMRSAAEIRRLADTGAPGSFELVGHSPLLNRGMNAALAVHGGYAYVGNRTDGTHLDPGVLVVDVREPAAPEVVGQIGPPDAGNVGESSRELRILPEQGLLMVLNHGCSELIHRCANTSQLGATPVVSNIRFFDIRGENAAAPKLVSTYLPSRTGAQTPHEVFAWNDPERPGRVLLYMTTPSNSVPEGRENLIVTDISNARENDFVELTKWTTAIDNEERDNRLHSLTVSPDGRRAYFAYLGGGFLVADTSDFAAAKADPEVRLVTPVAQRVFWTDPGAHSAIKLPGQDFAMTTDEVYGKLGGVLAAHGCPWGWVRFIDLADPTQPRIASEFKLPVNEADTCAETPVDRENLASFSAHNPTLARHLAFVTWHGAGFQAIDITNPRAPRSAAQFVPEPLPYVQTEDPALSMGRDKVVMWSFPIIVDGLIYVVDLRNGLYVLRYKGPHQGEVSQTEFLDGNSNSGDAVRLDR
jgi:hypothetical protein